MDRRVTRRSAGRVRHVAPCLLVASVASTIVAQHAYIRGAGGEWRAVEAQRQGETVSVRVRPEDTDNGHALLVVNKPEWMELEDGEAPSVVAVTVGDRAVEVGEGLALTSVGSQRSIRVTLADGENPIAPDSVCLTLGGERFAPTASEAHGLHLAATLDLSSLGPGLHEGTLAATDRSPAANRLELPVSITIDGVRRHDDGQTATLCVGDHVFTVGGAGNATRFLRIEGTNVALYLTSQIGGQWAYAREVRTLGELADGDGVHLVTNVGESDGSEVDQVAELEFDVRVAPDVAGLLVESKCRNLQQDGPVYCFWGWAPGNGYVDPNGEHEWSMTYSEVGKVGWVFLPATDGVGAGVGLISPLVFGESRFGTMLIYTDPTRIETPVGGEVTMGFAVVVADSAEEVALACGDLRDSPWWNGE